MILGFWGSKVIQNSGPEDDKSWARVVVLFLDFWEGLIFTDILTSLLPLDPSWKKGQKGGFKENFFKSSIFELFWRTKLFLLGDFGLPWRRSKIDQKWLFLGFLGPFWSRKGGFSENRSFSGTSDPGCFWGHFWPLKWSKMIIFEDLKWLIFRGQVNWGGRILAAVVIFQNEIFWKTCTGSSF